jgi:DNA-directed RNA polymerase subunit F
VKKVNQVLLTLQTSSTTSILTALQKELLPQMAFRHSKKVSFSRKMVKLNTPKLTTLVADLIQVPSVEDRLITKVARTLPLLLISKTIR